MRCRVLEKSKYKRRARWPLATGKSSNTYKAIYLQNDYWRPLRPGIAIMRADN